ncbi:MAG: metallopeptidase family protein [Opitutales bacterium]
MTDSVYRRMLQVAEPEVKRAQDGLPEELRKKAREVPVIFEPYPSDDLVADGVEPDLLGLFSGHAYPDEVSDPPAPPQVYLFLENLWDYCEEDEATFAEEVRITYLHELGHYLGLEEADLESRGLA